MAITASSGHFHHAHSSPRVRWDASAVAYRLLHVGFVVLPFLAGIDKLTVDLGNWTRYLAPSIPHLFNLTPSAFMMLVGAVEVAASIVVMLMPLLGACVVAGWLCAIILNLLMLRDFYDVALRDVGLTVAAIALAFLARGARRSVPTDGATF